MRRARLVFLTLLACSLASSLLSFAAAPAQAHDPLAYLVTHPNEGITAIDLTTGAVSETGPVNEQRAQIAFSPDGLTGYVASGEGLQEFNVETGQVHRESLGSEGWVKHLAISPDGKTAYVDLDGSSWLDYVELAGRRENGMIDLGQFQSVGPLAQTLDGRTLFVVNSAQHALVPIETATHALGAPIVIDSGEEVVKQIVMSPDGRTAYVAMQTFGSIVPVDIASRTAGPAIQLHGGPISGLALSPDGRTGYATNPGTNQVTPFNLATGADETPIPVGKDPSSIAITPNGRMAYVTNYESASVTPIDLTTRTALAPIAVGNYPEQISIDAALSPAPPAGGSGGAPVPAPVASAPVHRAVARCTVPHLARLGLLAIRKRLRRNHCRLGRIERRHSRRRRGRLVSQSVRPGRRLAANAKVGVVLSRGPAPG